MAETTEKNTVWVVTAYVLIGLLVAWVLSEVTKTVFVKVRVEDLQILGNTFTLANLIGLAISGGTGAYLWRNEKINVASHEVVSELRKVTWTSRKETQTSTVVVLVTTVIISTILWVFDLFWAWATSAIYG